MRQPAPARRCIRCGAARESAGPAATFSPSPAPAPFRAPRGATAEVHWDSGVHGPREVFSWSPEPSVAEMQLQDQRLLLTLRHLHRVLEELRAESAQWEDAKSSGGTSPIRARAGSEGRGHQPLSSRRLAQLLQGLDSRRSSLP
ncbi:PREDICTED: uncharacterized protein C20orf202 homolog [Hipposideros armiger]|uniref:Uncharacterized protein C20orf202 homolog n=1 Tax=Hipposideros armiger TaxID=186990 RepID=A0A8B7RK10_HIPAR|nr:PREDICTED: uncharacterized protein C20orf202 homolog [Hipposideros armiger]